MSNTAWLVVLYVVAMILFILAAFNINPPRVSLIALGLAVLTLAFMLKAAGVL